MRDPFRTLVLPAAMALAWVPPPAALAAPATRLPLQFIDVLGRVSGPDGGGLAGVRVVLAGARDVATTTDASGGYTLTVPVALLGDPARRAVTARITAQRPGWAFALRNGQEALAIELRLQTRAEPARCRVRANVMQSVDAIVAAIRRGDRNAIIANADFVGREGGPRGRRVTLRSDALTVVGEPTEPEIVVTAGDDAARAAAPQARAARETGRDGRTPAPRPAQRAVSDTAARAPREASPATPVTRVTPAPEAIPAVPTPPRAEPGRAERPRVEPPRAGVDDRRERPSARPRIRRIEAERTPRDSGATTPDPGSVKLPGPGVTQTDATLIRRIETNSGAAEMPNTTREPVGVLAHDGECACRIRGTVEIHPDHLLTKRLDLIVLLREAPSVRDTIQLFMGSPRPFDLPAVRCGTWHIDVDAVARRHFEIVSADGRGPIDCREGGLRQLRVVLDPK